MGRKYFVRVYAGRLILGILSVTFTSLAAAATMADKGDPIEVGTRYRIESKILGETRFYLVHKPPQYDSRKGAFPVLYLLDGDANFMHTSAAADLLADNLRIPELLIIGVSNTDRERDLSPPTRIETTPQGINPRADKFLAFLSEELIPTVDRNFRTRPYRILVGHSLGGLFAVYSLENKPELFNAYIAISPSLWWDRQSLATSASIFLDAHKDLRGDFYMTMANEGAAMLGGAWKLAAAFEESKPSEFRWQFQRHPEETHGSIPYRSTYDGLQAIFDGWHVSDPLALYDGGGLDGLEKHFNAVSKRVGYDVPIPEYVLNIAAQMLDRNGRSGEAEPLIKRDLELYPDNFYAHLNAATHYVVVNDQSRAIEYLTNALRIFPGNTDVRSQLLRLKVDVNEIVHDVKLTTKELRLISGEYKMPDGVARISIEAETLRLQTSSGTRCELHALSNTRLYCIDDDLEFTLKRQGSKVDGYTVDFPTYSEYHAKIR